MSNRAEPTNIQQFLVFQYFFLSFNWKKICGNFEFWGQKSSFPKESTCCVLRGGGGGSVGWFCLWATLRHVCHAKKRNHTLWSYQMCQCSLSSSILKALDCFFISFPFPYSAFLPSLQKLMAHLACRLDLSQSSLFWSSCVRIGNSEKGFLKKLISLFWETNQFFSKIVDRVWHLEFNSFFWGFEIIVYFLFNIGNSRWASFDKRISLCWKTN